MTVDARIVVTAGPTISAAEIRSVVPTAEMVPPISFGQALGYGLRPGDTLLTRRWVLQHGRTARSRTASIRHGRLRLGLRGLPGWAAGGR